MSDEPVELRTAYSWDCPTCGRENFGRAIVREFSPEERQAMEAEHGLEFKTGDWVVTPKIVECKTCGIRHPTTEYDSPLPGEGSGE